jgi:hypothetical protein
MNILRLVGQNALIGKDAPVRHAANDVLGYAHIMVWGMVADKIRNEIGYQREY